MYLTESLSKYLNSCTVSSWFNKVFGSLIPTLMLTELKSFRMGFISLIIQIKNLSA